jgi:hypothetical protein
MLLNDYVNEQMVLLKEFQIRWENLNKKLPVKYPLDLDPGQWDEQFLATLSYVKVEEINF